MAVELLGVPVHITEGSGTNIKLTTREDVVIADAILRAMGASEGAD
jgi:2-C-methyl-D-erythritol 4-phosphate cytidylyltransferase